MDVLASEVKTFVDAGANVGDWSARLLQRSGVAKGYCFDPSRQCAARLRDRFANEPVEIRQLALSNQAGEASFLEKSDCGETSSLFGPGNCADGTIAQVQVATLDNEIEQQEEAIDWVKVDCEGWDLKVLQGAKELLNRVRFVQFEYNTYWLRSGSSLREAINYLETFGFQIYVIKNDGLHPFCYEIWGDYFRYSNFFACRAGDVRVVSAILGHEI